MKGKDLHWRYHPDQIWNVYDLDTKPSNANPLETNYLIYG